MNGYSTRSRSNGQNTKTPTNPTLFEYPPNQEVDDARGVITFTQHDLRQLKPPKYLNDTNISFFMQYHLDKMVSKEVKDRTHVFNSFFFAKIKSIKTQQNGKGGGNFKCASRWLKGVEIFRKDFLIMPVCERDHWVLVIVCYPARNPSGKSNMIPDDELYEPAVFVLNSSYGCAPSVKKALHQFLKFQWHIERGEEEKSFSIQHAKKNGIRLIFPRLPQQRNSYNCGVYILNYFYCFLKNPRAAYLKMYRQRDMKNWFEECGIEILRERRRMLEVIKSQILLWEKSANKAERVAKESQEILIGSPSSNSSSVDLIENGETIVIH